MIKLSKLFFIFCKIGLLMFGGGAAMLPILKAEIVDKRRYATSDELIDLYSISQCTPGIIAVNIATFIGHKLRGISGAVVATLGVITPAIFIIIAVASILSQFMDNRYVIYAFSGIRLAVVALIINVVIDLARNNIKHWGKTLVFVGTFIFLLFVKISPALLVIIMGTGAVALGELQRRYFK
ncbi:MAG: chromate transporter [Alphaproteobacteria bacterium]|nr:chromate transporter [Alphaproteobacteria bacterium]